jgi:hypothetical protein
MASGEQTTERQDRILAELSELGLVLARDLQARALQAEDAKTAADLSLAFHRISRSIRQTLALEAKLERDRQRQEREVRSDLAREAQGQVQKRWSQLSATVQREIWTEAEGDEAEHLLNDLDDWLEVEALSDDFALAPIETQIERIRQDLGLPAPEGDPLRPGWAGTPTVSRLTPRATSP